MSPFVALAPVATPGKVAVAIRVSSGGAQSPYPELGSAGSIWVEWRRANYAGPACRRLRELLPWRGMAGSSPKIARARVAVAAPASACWEAWTRPKSLEAWYPERVEGEVAPGCEVVFAWDSLGQSIPLEVVDARPPYRLVLRGHPPHRVFQEQEVRISDSGDHCEVEVVHSGFREGPGGEDERAGSEAGWKSMLAILKLYLENYADRPRVGSAALGAAAAGLERAYAELTGQLGLGDDPRAGQTGRLELSGGAPRDLEVLVAEPPYQILVSVPAIEGALSLRAFSTGPADAAIVAAQMWSWAADPRALDALASGVEERLDRVIATLGGPRAEA